MISSRSLLLLGCLAWQTQAQVGVPSPISCGSEVDGVVLPAGLSSTYTFTATSDGFMQPWTCGATTTDTMITVSAGGVIVAQSDDLGNVVCPSNPKASGVTVRILTGQTYSIAVSAGAAWRAGDDDDFSLEFNCNGPMDAYWERMFNNSGYEYGLFAELNGVWYYNGVSTCVAKGYYWGICPYHHVHCTGDSVYGWGSDQAAAVLEALASPGFKYPGYSTGCPSDLICGSSQYTCVNKNCVDVENLCDGTDDCGDGSDEDINLTKDLCGDVECVTHVQCDGDAYCNSENVCVEPCGSCTDDADAIDGTCPTCSGIGGDDCPLGFGCTNPAGINYNPFLDPECDDGSCEACFPDTTGPSLHLVTDNPSGLNVALCGLTADGHVELSCHTSQKYSTSMVSLLSPITADQPFSTTFDNQGRNPSTTPVHWDHSLGQICDNNYGGVFQWEDILTNDDSSILIRTELAEQVMFTGWIAVDMFEQLDPLRNVNLTRWVRQKLPFRIIFETDVTAIASNLKVHNEYNTFFAIVEQKTIVVNSQVSPPSIEADIVLWSSIEYPFRLVHTAVRVNVPELENGLTVDLLEDCSPASGQPCNQQLLIGVDLEDECYFTGQYTVDFEIECLPSVNPADCPLDSSTTHTAFVDFDIETENVCPTMIINVVSTGSVKSYQNPRIGTGPYIGNEHFAFMVNNWACFEVTMESIDGLIVETIVSQIDLCFDVTCANPTRIYNNGVATVADLQLSVFDYPRDAATSTSPLPFNSDIKMYLSENLFTVPFDGCIDFFLIIEVEVLYFNTQTLLEEDEAHDMNMVTVEELRSKKRTQKILLSDATPNSESATTTTTGSVSGVGNHANANDAPAAVDPEIAQVASTEDAASAITTSLVGTIAAVVVTLALW